MVSLILLLQAILQRNYQMYAQTYKNDNNQYLKKANRDITRCIVFDAGVTVVKYFLLTIEGFNFSI